MNDLIPEEMVSVAEHVKITNLLAEVSCRSFPKRRPARKEETSPLHDFANAHAGSGSVCADGYSMALLRPTHRY